MRYSLLLLGAAAAILSACGSDASTSTGTSSGGSTTPVYTVTFDSGAVDSASAPTGTVIPVKIHVKKAGVGVANMTVTWNVTGGHGAVGTASTTTDANGASSNTWTLGDTIGINAVNAVSGDASATLSAKVIAGAPSTLSKVSVDSTSVVAGGAVILTARVADRFSNPVTGAAVTWTTTAGSLSVTSATSGASGNASTALTTSGAGTYLVTASLPGRASVTFKVVAF